LRTVSQGHPDYRFISKEVSSGQRNSPPRVVMLVDLNDYAIARRGTEEQILAKEG
jgi:hypothetical protein